ncbi:hypothetical protein [Desulfonatronum parangueonense]
MTSSIGLTPLRIFWSLYFITAVWLQLFVSGMDFFVPGILLCLQQERLRHALFLVLLSVLIQEGTGPLVFGTSILRYGSLIGLFFLGRSFFESRSPIFIFFLIFAFTLLHLIILQTMAGLQSLTISSQRLLWESAFVFVTFLASWLILNACYRFFSRYESLS